MDWLLGLQNLLNGVQNPDAFALKAAASGADVGAVDAFLNQAMPGVLGAQVPMGPQGAPGQTTGAVPNTFSQMLYGGQGLPQPGGFSPASLTGAVEPKTTTLPEVGATADRLGYSRSPLLDSITPTPGWINMQSEEAKRGLAEKKPELTAEQVAKLASMIPKPTAANFPSAGSAHPVDPRTINTGQLSVLQRQRPSLAQILGR